MQLDFSKYADALMPAIVQDSKTSKVLMLGFMNEESINITNHTGKVTFYSRSKKSLWTKGETSGNYLLLDSMCADCDADTILIKATPTGPVCHTGADTCWNETNLSTDFISTLENIIAQRKKMSPENSYVASLFSKGINKVAQKVGEEAIELVIESKDNNDNLFLNEAADLLFHYLILLQMKGFNLHHVIDILEKRHLKSNNEK